MDRIRPVGKEREASVLAEGSNMQDTRRWTLSGQNKKNGGNSVGKKKMTRPSDFLTSDHVSKL